MAEYLAKLLNEIDNAEGGIAYNHKSTNIDTYQRTNIIIKLSHYRKFNKILVPVLRH